MKYVGESDAAENGKLPEPPHVKGVPLETPSHGRATLKNVTVSAVLFYAVAAVAIFLLTRSPTYAALGPLGGLAVAGALLAWDRKK